MVDSFQTFLVGGAVRDHLLGLPCKDRDFVVVGATVADMEAQGFQLTGNDFPVFRHPFHEGEWALARRERKTGTGHKGFSVEFDPTVTLAEDLLRRDLTVNAMAMDPITFKVFDPHGGGQDLERGILRACSPQSFVEDPLRVLRLARFAARFPDFVVDPATLDLCRQVVAAGELQHLTVERVFMELEKALRAEVPSQFFMMLRQVGALKVLFPEVDALFDVPQDERHHPEGSAGVHTMMVVDAAARMKPENVRVMFGALCHDLGKAVTDPAMWPKQHGHDVLGAPVARQMMERLKAPTDVVRFATMAAALHMRMQWWDEMRESKVLDLLKRMDGLRRLSMVSDMLMVADADHLGRDREPDMKDLALRRRFLMQAAAEAGAVSADDIVAGSDKAPGPWVGQRLEQRQVAAVKRVRRRVRDFSQFVEG